jgi:mycothiol synthase
VANLTTRPYEPGDAAVLADLMNTIEEYAGGRATYTDDEIQELAESLVTKAETDTRMVFDDAGRLVASGMVTTPPTDGIRADLYGGVHPDRRGEGIGRELLAWQYQRATEIHAERAPGALWQAETGTLRGEATAERLLPRLDFAPVRYFFDMVAPAVPVQPAPPLPAGLRSVVPDPELSRRLYEAHVAAFADHWGYAAREYDTWMALTLNSARFRPAESRVALAGDEVAGYVLGYEDASPDRLYIGQVGTARPWRRRGLAGALLAEVLAAAGAAGRAEASLGVDADSPTGAVGLYERAGFAQEHCFVAYHRPIPPTAP